MYVPPHFDEKDRAEIDKLIDSFPLAILVANGPDGVFANHIPLLRQGADQLIGHIARNNDMHRQIENGSDVLAIIRGDDSYISPNWYPTKPDHHKHVPTWNYQAVHIYGTISFHFDEKSKQAVVGRLTKYHEARVNGLAGWKMADAPKAYMDQMLAQIVAFEIQITKIIAKSKLSQNRDLVDFVNVAKMLDRAHKKTLAKRMDDLSKSR